MSTVMPKDKKVQDAFRWISEQASENKDYKKLIQEAAFKYNLNPKQEDYLKRLFQDEQKS